MIRAAWAILLGSALAACQPGDKPGSEYIEDMARGPAYKAFSPNPATRNGITLQHPVPGTIARGYQPFHYGKGEAEARRAGRELTNPVPPNSTNLAKGKELYDIYCLVCHGAEGKGDGPISSKIPTPPSYKSDRLLDFLPGRIFHVITLGSNRMPSYAAQLSPDDRWLITTYVRATLQGLPEAEPGTPDSPSATPPDGAAAPADGSAAPAPGSAAPAAGSAVPPASPAAGSAAPAAAPAGPPGAGASPTAPGAAPGSSVPQAAPSGAPAEASKPPAPAAGSGGKP